MEWKLKPTNETIYNIVKDKTSDDHLAKVMSTMDITESFTKKILECMDNKITKSDVFHYCTTVASSTDYTGVWLSHSIMDKKKIMVITDYDSDGVNAAAMAYKFFKNVLAYDPDKYIIYVNRPSNGYGINSNIVNKVKELYKDKKVDVIITMDHGIVDEPSYAELKKECSDLKILVTDHHEIQEKLYPISANHVANNKIKTNYENLKDEPLLEASGCLVGFYVLYSAYCHMMRFANKGEFEKFTDVNNSIGFYQDDLFNELYPHLAISLLSDVIPVNTFYNRLILTYGLDVLNKFESKYPCWNALRDLFKFPSDKLFTEEDLIFKISPLLNLGKRAGEPELVFKLLTTDSWRDAIDAINTLNIFNATRKNVTNEIYRHVKNSLSGAYKFSKVAIINNELNIGGNLATRISEDNHGVPSICFNGNLDGSTLEGSGRSSISTIDFVTILKEVEELGRKEDMEIFVKYGGHKEAAGITIHAKYFDVFKKLFEKVASKYIKESDLITTKYYNMDIDSSEFITYGNITRMLSPYGKNYNRPIFKTRLEAIETRKCSTYATIIFDINGTKVNGFYPIKNDTDKAKINQLLRTFTNDRYGYERDFIYTISPFVKQNEKTGELYVKYSMSILGIL